MLCRFFEYSVNCIKKSLTSRFRVGGQVFSAGRGSTVLGLSAGLQPPGRGPALNLGGIAEDAPALELLDRAQGELQGQVLAPLIPGGAVVHAAELALRRLEELLVIAVDIGLVQNGPAVQRLELGPQQPGHDGQDCQDRPHPGHKELHPPGHFGGRGRRGGDGLLHPQELAHGEPEEPGQGDEVVQLRDGLVGVT